MSKPAIFLIQDPTEVSQSEQTLVGKPTSFLELATPSNMIY